MGRKKKQPQDGVLYQISRMMVPATYLEYYEIIEVKETKVEWQITLHEKEHLVPDNLKDKVDVVHDGYCTPVQILSHCFSLKPVF